MKKYFLVIFFLSFQCVVLTAQDWELKKLDLGAMPSTEVAEQGDFYISFSHRFGSLTGSDSTFFQSKNHNSNLEIIYGIWEGFQLGLSWETLRDTYGGSAKMVLMKQDDDYSMDVTALGAIHLNAELSEERYPFMKFPDRLSYTSQILLGRHFSQKLFLEIAPTFIRQNLVWEPIQNHNQFAIGFGGSFQLAEQVSLYLNYVAHLNRNATTVFNDPLTIGLDFNINKYLLGISVSNAQSFNAPSFISNAEGDWGSGDVFVGINATRIF